jgi:hypothetical protein
MVPAKNLRHRDTRMVEPNYGHLAPSFIVDAIQANARDYGSAHDSGGAVASKQAVKNSRANICHARPLKPDRFSSSLFAPPRRFCTVRSERVENKKGKRITNAGNG